MATRTKKTEDETVEVPRIKQGHLAGLEPPTYPAIDEAAEKYHSLIAKSFKLRQTCDEAKEELMKVMGDHKLTYYVYDDKEVEVMDKITVKVRKKKDDDE